MGSDSRTIDRDGDRRCVQLVYRHARCQFSTMVSAFKFVRHGRKRGRSRARGEAAMESAGGVILLVGVTKRSQIDEGNEEFLEGP